MKLARLMDDALGGFAAPIALPRPQVTPYFCVCLCVQTTVLMNNVDETRESRQWPLIDRRGHEFGHAHRVAGIGTP